MIHKPQMISVAHKGLVDGENHGGQSYSPFRITGSRDPIKNSESRTQSRIPISTNSNSSQQPSYTWEILDTASS